MMAHPAARRDGYPRTGYMIKPEDEAQPHLAYGSARLIIPSARFVANYVAPEFLIESIFQRSRIFSLTGRTGDAKTAIKLYLAYLLATGTPLGWREVEQCPVLYLAGGESGRCSSSMACDGR